MVWNASELGGGGGAQELGKLGCGKERRPGHKTGSAKALHIRKLVWAERRAIQGSQGRKEVQLNGPCDITLRNLAPKEGRSHCWALGRGVA